MDVLECDFSHNVVKMLLNWFLYKFHYALMISQGHQESTNCPEKKPILYYEKSSSYPKNAAFIIENNLAYFSLIFNKK